MLDTAYEKITVRDSDYLKEYMQQDTFNRAFAPEDESTDKMELLMYGTLVGIGVLAFLIMMNM